MGYVVCGIAAACVLFAMVCFWRIFVKAGRSGWKSVVPVYNGAVLLRIVGRPLWWLVPLCIPVVGLVPFLVVLMDLGRAFGKGRIWGLFFPALAFGSARFEGARLGGAR
jgi:signal peptidase I